MFQAVNNSVIGRYAEQSRRPKFLDVGFSVLQVLLAGAFLVAGVTKLAGAQMYAGPVGSGGLDQWLRYSSGVAEVIAAMLILIPRAVVIGVAVLIVTVIGVIDTQLFVVGGRSVPALVLVPLTGTWAWYRVIYR